MQFLNIIYLFDLFNQQGLRGPMDKALVYGTRDSGFDPQRSRFLYSVYELYYYYYKLFFAIVNICQDGRVV